jgi:AMMECR1 domain-containing protein
MSRNWSAERFLDETCLKAGLSAEAWHDPLTNLFALEADIFCESDFSAAYSSST